MGWDEVESGPSGKGTNQVKNQREFISSRMFLFFFPLRPVKTNWHAFPALTDGKSLINLSEPPSSKDEM